MTASCRNLTAGKLDGLPHAGKSALLAKAPNTGADHRASDPKVILFVAEPVAKSSSIHRSHVLCVSKYPSDGGTGQYDL